MVWSGAWALTIDALDFIKVCIPGSSLRLGQHNDIKWPLMTGEIVSSKTYLTFLILHVPNVVYAPSSLGRKVLQVARDIEACGWKP